MRFTNKVALIVGAGNGIGAVTSDIIASEGGIVVGVDVNEAGLDAAANKIQEAGGVFETHVSSALVEADVTNVVEATMARHARIDILVNAVGGSTAIANPGTLIDEMTLDEWRALMEFNLTGTFLYCNAVVPIMKRQKSGKIVNLASIAGRGLSTVSSGAYAAAKGGIIALTRKLSIELGAYGINCNAIAPGLTLTKRIQAVWDASTPEKKEAVLRNTPLGRLPMAEDQARVICFLASHDADFITGTTIDVAGGAR